MAGTNTITYQDHMLVKTVTMAWTSDSRGDVNTTLTGHLNGIIERCVLDSSTSAIPTTAYDVYVYDAYGNDILNGAGAGLSTTGSPPFVKVVGVTLSGSTGGASSVCYPVDEPLQLVVENAGANKSGTVVLYYRGEEVYDT